jgi:aminoglycoside phosphotransferase
MSILIYCIQLGGQAIVMTERAFADRIHDLDITNMVTKLTADTNVFYGHFLDSFDRSSSDMEPLKVQIAVLQRMRDRGEI